jgi:hypothetical protein
VALFLIFFFREIWRPFKHQLCISRKKNTVAERSVLLVAVEKMGVSFFCENFLKGGLHVRGNIIILETTGVIPVNFAILFFTLFLIYTVK